MTPTNTKIILQLSLTPIDLGLSESLWGLIHRVSLGDRKARDRILDLSLFFWNGHMLTILELLDELIATERAWECAGRNSLVLDAAYNQSIDKFTHIPTLNENGTRGPDARFYYYAMTTHIAKLLTGRPLPDALELEHLVRRVFLKFLVRHVYRAIRDCYRRIAGLRSRYVWNSLVLWLPREIGGRQRRTLLEAIVGDVDPKVPGEQERVQQIIDRYWTNRCVLSLDDIEVSAQPSLKLNLPWSLEFGISSFGLAHTLAVEKSSNLSQQRKAIAALGAQRLMALVLRIFNDLDSGDYRPSEIADAFRLDRATFSRFAGIRWRKGDLTAVPDLFRNLAWVVAQDPRWSECAQAAGIWPRLKDILERQRSAT